jgi:hypothetical protein
MHAPEQSEPITGTAMAADVVTAAIAIVEGVSITTTAGRTRTSLLRAQKRVSDAKLRQDSGPG